MISVKKRKRRRFKPLNFGLLIFSFTVVVWIFSSILIKAEEVSLQVSIQNTRETIAQTKLSNEQLALEISDLANYQRVATIAKDEGLQTYQTNVISLDDIKP